MIDSKLNLCRHVGVIITSCIEEISLEETVNRESLGRFLAGDLFNGLYNAAVNSSNPTSFLRSVRYWAKCGTEESNGGKKLILEFYK